jgi:uncharacterized membrane protein
MSPNADKRGGMRHRLAKLTPLVVAAILFSRHLFADFFGDEWGHTRSVVIDDAFWKNFLAPEMSHPPLYFILARLAWVTTHVEWAMRLPSLLAALATVWIVGFLADRVGGQRLVAPARWLAACSPFLMDFATEARPYALLILFATGSVWAFLRMMESEDRRAAALLAVMLTAGVLTHYFFGLLSGFLVLWYTCRRSRFTRSAAIAFLPPLFVVVLLGVLLFVVQRGAATDIVHVGAMRERLQAPNFLARLAVALNYGYCAFWLPPLDFARNVPTGALTRNIPQFVMLAVAVAGFAVAFWRLLRAHTRFLAPLSFGLVVPTVLAVTAGVLGVFLVREKYLALIWPFALILAAMAARNLLATNLGRIAVAAHLGIIALSAIHFLVFPNIYSRRMDWTGLRTTLESANKADVVLSYLNDQRGWPISHNPSHRDAVSECMVVRNSLRRGETMATLALRLNTETAGKILLVDNETDRHEVDPNGDLPRVLTSLRPLTLTPFGRNLQLYTFAQPAGK